MNPYVADPQWHGYIIWYFFLGGIAAGAYVMGALARLVGDEDEHRAARLADFIAFPLVCVCGVLLIVDLGRPERFWHMMLQSETGRPMFKWWSPMSAGSWGLMVFGAFSFVSFLAALAEENRLGLGRWSAWAHRLHRGGIGWLFALGGALSALFLGAYTGTLLSATNQPAWSDTTWLSALFLASSASTGLAAMILLIVWRRPDLPPAAVARWEGADTWAIGLELLMLGVLAASLGGLALPAFGRWPGLLIPAFVVPVGLVAPLVVRHVPGRWGAMASAGLVLLGGFALRAAIVGMPAAFRLAHP